MVEESDSSQFNQKYKYGFVTDIAEERIRPGLDEEVIRIISQKKNEPEWMLQWRLEAFHKWLKMKEPRWARVNYPPIDFQKIVYYSSPRDMNKAPKSLEDVDPKLLETYEKLGIPLHERGMLAGVAVDAVFDSVSVVTTHRETLAKLGIIFGSVSEALQQHPDLVKKYLGSVVPQADNYYAALNSAVFSDGSFCYIPPGVKCPVDLSTYFRINALGTGQFERTLIIADEGAELTYMEGCTAPMRDENQLHAAVVELVALKNATIRYTTVQNWYAGDADGKGGIYNFVTKRGACRGERSRISWTQVETGSSITWKYPSCLLEGKESSGEFYSVAITNERMQADTGTKMIHVGENTRSRIVSKGISTGFGRNSYRGMVIMTPAAKNSRNHTRCDSLLIGKNAAANTYPWIQVRNKTSVVEHEATASKVNEEQLFYLLSRGVTEEEAIKLIISGYCEEVFSKLPMEFAIEASRLLQMKLEGSVG